MDRELQQRHCQSLSLGHHSSTGAAHTGQTISETETTADEETFQGNDKQPDLKTVPSPAALYVSPEVSRLSTNGQISTSMSQTQRLDPPTQIHQEDHLEPSSAESISFSIADARCKADTVPLPKPIRYRLHAQVCYWENLKKAGELYPYED
ncbi:MAG: hypothetical protein M1836_002230 [Candelina mexicana]|nr:MAG: hypothetical protein M1836_002230 [Candelina mexicana]